MKRNLKKLEETIRAKARYSLVVLGLAFVRHGSGRFLWLGPPPEKKSAVRKQRSR
ncbi:MAG: hypothetical protein AAB517_01025 [Patescibacteria group bacterium]